MANINEARGTLLPTLGSSGWSHPECLSLILLIPASAVRGVVTPQARTQTAGLAQCPRSCMEAGRQKRPTRRGEAAKQAWLTHIHSNSEALRIRLRRSEWKPKGGKRKHWLAEHLPSRAVEGGPPKYTSPNQPGACKRIQFLRCPASSTSRVGWDCGDDAADRRKGAGGDRAGPRFLGAKVGSLTPPAPTMYRVYRHVLGMERGTCEVCPDNQTLQQTAFANNRGMEDDRSISKGETSLGKLMLLRSTVHM